MVKSNNDLLTLCLHGGGLNNTCVCMRKEVIIMTEGLMY